MRANQPERERPSPGRGEARLVATVWDDEQVLCEAPPEELGVRLWAATATRLIGPSESATVSIDCDDGESEMRLRVAGFQVAEVDQSAEVVESVTLERNGPLSELLEPILRLPPGAPLGALAQTEICGVDLDYGSGLDVWGPEALHSLRDACREVGLTLAEEPPE